MSRALFSAFIWSATALLASGARAQTAAPAPAQTQSAAQNATQTQTNQAASQDASATPVRVRASHKVEVIAPGEHVETIIDRMRASSAATAATPESATPAERLPVRGPELQRGADRGANDRQRGERGAAPGAPPGGGPGAGPNGNGPPPERR